MKFENFQEAYLHNMKNVYLTPNLSMSQEETRVKKY